MGSGRTTSAITFTAAAVTNSDYWREPPLADSEAEHLVGALGRLRAAFCWKADDLDAAGLQARIGASSLTLGGLLKHLARAEEQMFSTKLSGAPLGAPWDTADWDTDPDWEFNSATNDTRTAIRALRQHCRTVPREARRGLGGLDQLVHLSLARRRRLSLRRLLCDLIEEYGRHTGHADLLREASTDWPVKTLHLDGTQSPNRLRLSS
jgi:hypothetical protein